MSTTSTVSNTIWQIILQPSRGVAGVVDDLLMVCRNQALQLAWQDGRCHVCSSTGDWEDWIECAASQVRLSRSSRSFGDCLQRTAPDSVSPYAGQAELSVGEPPALMRVSFVNTPAEQKLFLAGSQALLRTTTSGVSRDPVTISWESVPGGLVFPAKTDLKREKSEIRGVRPPLPMGDR